MRIPRPLLAFAGGAATGAACARAFSGEAPLGMPPLITAAVSLFGLATFAFVAVAGAAILNKDRAPHLWRAAAIVGAAMVGLALGAWIGRLSLGDRLRVTHERADVILEAMNRCAERTKEVPASLAQLVPDYMTFVPETAYGGPFRFERGPGFYRLYFFDDWGVRHTYDSTSKRWVAE
jgi:hypothetical protein